MTPVTVHYASYDQVPTLRKQWFFWITWFVFAPIAVVILITGDVYYRKKGEVRAFGMANRVVAGLLALLWLYAIIRATADGPDATFQG